MSLTAMYSIYVTLFALATQLLVVFSSNQSCSPGFTYSDDESKCLCVESSYNSLITCGPSCDVNRTATIVRGGWIGNYSGEILGGSSIYLFSLSERGILMPQEWSEVNEALCGRLHRKGMLCGTCKDGYGPAMNIHFYQCVKCTSKDSHLNWLWYILLEYFPLTVMFFVLLIFDLNTTSGAGNAFIFFAQMVTTIFDIFQDGVISLDNATYNNTHALRAIHQLPYGIWNMEFFSLLAPPFCLSSAIGTYGIILINYAIALYPILLIMLFSFVIWLHGRGLNLTTLMCPAFYRCILRIQKKWEFRRSLVGVFATFIIMSYTKMLSTSVRLIKPTSLYSSDNHVVHVNIPTFNGNAYYTDSDLLAMYIIAVVTLCIYVAILPCFLMTPSIVKAIHHRTKWEWLAKILPWGRTQEFLDAFHSCYVDGGRKGNDYRWFSGVFLIIRGMFFLASTFAPSTMMGYMFLCCLCFITAFAIACIRPFKIKHHNTLNVGVFCVLGIITCVNTYFTYQSTMWLSIAPVFFWMEYLLVLFPLLIIIIKLITWVWNKCKRKSVANNYLQNFDTDEESTIDDRDRQEAEEDDSFDFLKFTEKTGRLKRNNREVTWYIPSPSCSNKSYSTKNEDSLASTMHEYGSIN